MYKSRLLGYDRADILFEKAIMTVEEMSRH